MKNLFICLTLSAFAVTSVLADNAVPTKASADKKSACCASSKGCCEKTTSCHKMACKSMPSKTVLLSPKAEASK